jgi:hypothetical protein
MTEGGVLVAVEGGAAEGGDRVDLAELAVEKPAPPVLGPGGNDGFYSVESGGAESGSGTSFGYEGGGGCKEVL